MPLSITVTIFQGHNSIKQFQLKIECSVSDPIRLKLCMVVIVVKYAC